jgi:sporulation protein YlmC with PRC-barrel domain
VHVEWLVGQRVRDAEGKSLGRIEEIVAEISGTDWIVLEVHLGPGALMERLLEISTLFPLSGLLRRRFGERIRVPWDRLDLNDPSHPRATVRRDELEVSS